MSMIQNSESPQPLSTQIALHFPYLRISGQKAFDFNHWINVGIAQGAQRNGHYVFDEESKTLEALNLHLGGPTQLINSLHAVFSSGIFALKPS